MINQLIKTWLKTLDNSLHQSIISTGKDFFDKINQIFSKDNIDLNMLNNEDGY